jgi:hypothetical protein
MAAGLMVMVLVAWVSWITSEAPGEKPAVARAQTMSSDPRDAGTAGLGDAAASTSMEEEPSFSTSETMAEDTLPEPLLGQQEPDAKGRCPHRMQVSLNGGCWVLQKQEPEECEALTGQMYKGTCYVPVLPHKRLRPPTSNPTKESVPR